MKMNKKEPHLRFSKFTEGWEQKKLDDVLEIATRINSDNEFDKNKVLSVSDEYGIVNQIEFQGRSFAAENVSNYKKVYKDDIIYTRSPLATKPFGIIKIVDNEEGILSPLYIVNTPKEKNDSKFIYYRFDSPERTNNYLLPLVRKGAKNTMNISNEEWLSGNIIVAPTKEEQQKIGLFFNKIDQNIYYHQKKIDKLKKIKNAYLNEMFPQKGQVVPKRRFKEFNGEWHEMLLGDLYERINERNDGTFDNTKWISVAKMYYQAPEKVTSNNILTRTYVMRLGDIAFEGHKNSEFKFGRFVENDIGAGVISELFPIYRPKTKYDLNYWKYAIQLESIMAPIYAKAITSSGTSSNKLNEHDLLIQKIRVPSYEEQKRIGAFFRTLDNQISAYQKEIEKLKNLKSSYLKEMFV